MTTLNTVEQDRLHVALEQAAFDVAQFGWANGNNTSGSLFDESENSPRCVWRSYIRSFERTVGGGRYGDALFTEGEDAIIRAARVTGIDELFHKNDSFNDEEQGQIWAYGVLLEAAKDFAPVPSEDKVADTGLTDQTESGNATNAHGLRKLFSKLFRKNK
jgi:hypothetical protein